MVNDLELLAAKVEAVVDDLKAAKNGNKELAKDNKRLGEQMALLEKEIQKSQKEGERTAELIAQNKEYKKKCSLLQSKVTSMLAKAEALQ
jgi:cell shape-determining protein MreC